MNLRFTIFNWRGYGIRLLLGATALLFAGCVSTCRESLSTHRTFNFQKDTFSFANGLLWEYHYTNGVAAHSRRRPKPDYALHCFAMARSARQFFQNARFDSNQPVADDKIYRELIDQVTAIDPRHHPPASDVVTIPGYANLRDFSATHEQLLKDECGGAWRSYVQRGNWRMVFPFFRSSQKTTARQLLAEVRSNRPPIAHLVRFPQETINHAVVVYDAKETKNEIQFTIYDPNHPDAPGTLIYDRASRTFILPANDYFPGGRVDVYEIYCDLIH